MNRLTRPVLIAATAGAVLLGAGCGGTDTQAAAPATGTATAAAAATDPTAWADGVCGSAQKFTAAATKVPQIDQSNPQAAVGSLSAYLGSVIAGVDEALGGLRTAGPSPVAGGDQAVTKLTDALTGYRNTFQQAKTGLDAADPNDPAALQGAIAPLTSLQNAPNPLAGLESNPELDKAAQQAPNCQALSKLGGQLGGAGAPGGTGGG